MGNMWLRSCSRFRRRWLQRVLMNSDGDMIVRPSFIEAAVQRRSTSSVAQHLLVNYQRVHIAIIKAQFTFKRLRDGIAVSGPFKTAYECCHAFPCESDFRVRMTSGG